MFKKIVDMAVATVLFSGIFNTRLLAASGQQVNDVADTQEIVY